MILSMELTLWKVGRLAGTLTVWQASRKKICLHAGCNCKTEWLKHAKIQASSFLEWSQKITVGKTLRKLHNRIHVQELADEESIRKGRHASKQVERESLET